MLVKVFDNKKYHIETYKQNKTDFYKYHIKLYDKQIEKYQTFKIDTKQTKNIIKYYKKYFNN